MDDRVLGIVRAELSRRTLLAARLLSAPRTRLGRDGMIHSGISFYGDADLAGILRQAAGNGLVTAVHWFHRPPTPNAFLATRPRGLLYVIELLEQAKVVLPRRVCELRDRLMAQAKTDPGSDRRS